MKIIATEVRYYGQWLSGGTWHDVTNDCNCKAEAERQLQRAKEYREPRNDRPAIEKTRIIKVRTIYEEV